MRFHCLDADFQSSCDLLVTVALGNQFDDLALPEWQGVRRALRGLEVMVQ